MPVAKNDVTMLNDRKLITHVLFLHNELLIVFI